MMFVKNFNPLAYLDTDKSIAKLRSVFILIGVSVLVINISPAFADPEVQWIRTFPLADFANIDGNSGDLFLNTTPVHLRVSDTDSGFVGNSISDTITVSLSSTTGDDIDLILNEVDDTGVFENNKVIFMQNDARISLGISAILTIEDESKAGNSIPNEVLDGFTEPIAVRSESHLSGILVDVSEVDDTGVFTTVLNFCNTSGCSDDNTSTLEISPNDTITAMFRKIDNVQIGYVISNLGGDGAIIAGDTSIVTASYDGVERAVIISFPGPGGGSGGPVAPVVVVDSGPFDDPDDPIVVDPSDGTGSGCSGDCTPPTLGVDEDGDRLVYDGFQYNGNPVDVELYYTPYPLITVDVGVENLTVLKIYDNNGPQNIAHVGLGFGLGKGESFNDSKATINLDISSDGTETTSLFDPENVLDNVQITTEEAPCGLNTTAQCLAVFIYHTFREPLNFNMVATYIWDFKLNAWQNYYNHGIEIVGDSLNPPKTELVYFGTKQLVGLYELVRIDKKQDIWQDKYGDLFQYLGNDRFDLVYKVPKETVYDKPTMHGCDRHCNWFEHYKLHQQLLAEINLRDTIMKGKPIQGEPPDEPFSHEFKILKRSEDPVLQQAILDEISRAEELFDLKFGDPYNWKTTSFLLPVR